MCGNYDDLCSLGARCRTGTVARTWIGPGQPVRWCAITTNCQEKLTTRRLRCVFLHRLQKSQTSISVHDVVVASFVRNIARRAPLRRPRYFTQSSRDFTWLRVKALLHDRMEGVCALMQHHLSAMRLGKDSTGFVNQRMCY
jgi:hypothetical protein